MNTAGVGASITKTGADPQVASGRDRVRRRKTSRGERSLNVRPRHRAVRCRAREATEKQEHIAWIRCYAFVLWR